MFEKYSNTITPLQPLKCSGKIERVEGLLIESRGPQAVIGELCYINIPGKEQPVPAEVAAVHGEKLRLMPYGEVDGLSADCSVTAESTPLQIPVSYGLLGRVINALGEPIDGKGGLPVEQYIPIGNTPPPPLSRQIIREQVVTGVKAIDGMTPVGKGQRMGIFSGSGVGKSTLLGMIAKNTEADINIIALIGERGREVREFIENDLGEEGLKRSVIIVSTSDTPALARVRAAFTATAIAEYFRDQHSHNVMFLMDSVTRFALAQREIGLAIGEPPATKGFTPSVFTLLPKLMERTGNSDNGTITGFYTILVEGDDMDEPISDAVRGILDGHLILDRKLAHRSHYPAVDILGSISRMEKRISTPEQIENRAALRRLLALYTEKEDLINIGAYSKGTNPELDEAIEKNRAINTLLQQAIEEKSVLEEINRSIAEIAK